MPRLFEFAQGLIEPQGLNNKEAYKRDLSHQVMFGIFAAFHLSIASVIALQILKGPSFLVAWIQAGTMCGLLSSPIYVRWCQNITPAKAYARPHLFAWVCLGLAGIIRDPYFFSAAVFLSGLLFHVSVPFQAVMYESIYNRSIRGKIVALVKQWQLSIMMTIAWLLGAWLELDPYGYQYFLPFTALLGCFIAKNTEKIDLFTERVSQTKQGFSFKRAVSILRFDKNFFFFMLFQSILGIANISGVAVLQVYVNSENFLSASPGEAALLTGVIPSAAMFISIRFWGSIFDRINIVYYRAISSIVMGLGFIVYTLSNSIFFAIIGATIWGLGRGGGQLVWTIGVLAFAKSKDSATYMGIHTSLTGVRGVIAPFIGVAAIQSSVSPIWFCWMVAALIILSAVLTIFFVENPDNQKQIKQL